MAREQPFARRDWIIPTVIAEDGDLVEFEDAASQWLGQMLTTLLSVGGTLSIQAERTKVGQLAPNRHQAVTSALIATWTSNTGKLHNNIPDRNRPTESEDPIGLEEGN